MPVLILSRPLRWAFAIVGVLALVLAGMIAMPLSQPPALAWIHEGALAFGAPDRQPLSRYQARDGASLAYRLYPAANGARDRLAILVHGSSASSAEMHLIAKALADAGVAAVSSDARGHGESGTRGGIGHIGQRGSDLAD